MNESTAMLLKASDVAEVLQVSQWSILEAARTGRLGCVRIGRSVRFHPDDVDAFVKASRSKVETTTINWQALR